MPSSSRGFCLGLTMDGNDNIAPATVSTLPLQSSRTRTWQGHSTIPVRNRGRAYSLDNDRTNKINTDNAVDNVTSNMPKTHSGQPLTLVMEPGPVIKMGTVAVGQRKGLVSRAGEITSWKEISPKKEIMSPLSSPMKEQGTTGTDPGYHGKIKSDKTEGWVKAAISLSPVKTSPGSNDIRDASSGVTASSTKNVQKRQNPSSKSPRLARKMVSTAKYSNASAIPKRSSISSSSSSCETNNPKPVKPFKGKSISNLEKDMEHFDKLEFADRYKISEVAKLDRIVGIEHQDRAQLHLTTWKDISPTESKIETTSCTPSEKRSRPESGYFSNEVHSESREGMDGSLSEESDHAGTIKHRPKKQNVVIPNSELNSGKSESCLSNAVENGGTELCVEPTAMDDSKDNKGDTVIRKIKATEQIPTSSRNMSSHRNSEIGVSDKVEKRSKPKPTSDTTCETVVADSSKLTTRIDAVNRKLNAMSGAVNCGARQCYSEMSSRKDSSSTNSMDNSDSMGQSQEHPTSQDDGSFNDYFFDEDFIVQFGGNLHTSVGVILQGSCAFSLAEPMVPGFPGHNDSNVDKQHPILPQSFNGSYTAFGALRDSFLQNEDLYSGPCESEVSGTGSRTSMDVSSSEREMMCSSDMLDFPVNEPLFTPPCVSTSQDQNLSTDSLSHHLEEGEAQVTATTSLSGSRSSSTTADITVKCGPHKDAYFLSFDGGSQGKFSTTESESSYVSQTSSLGDKAGSQSLSSGADAEDEQSSSFQFANHRSRTATVSTATETGAAGEGSNFAAVATLAGEVGTTRHTTDCAPGT